MRVIHEDKYYRTIAVEDRGAFLAVFEKSHLRGGSGEFDYRGYVLKMSEPRSSLVERCKQCIRNHETFRTMAIGLDGLPIRGAV